MTELFENHEQTVPINQLGAVPKFPSYKQTSLFSFPAATGSLPLRGHRGKWIKAGEDSDLPSTLIPTSRSRTPHIDEEVVEAVLQKPAQRSKEAPKYDLSNGLSRFAKNATLPFTVPSAVAGSENASKAGGAGSFTSSIVDEMLSNIEDNSPEQEEDPAEDLSMDGILPTKPLANLHPPPSRMPKRKDASATITIGDRAPVTTGMEPGETLRKKRRVEDESAKEDGIKPSGVVSALSKFLAPGTQTSNKDQYPGHERRKRTEKSRIVDEDEDEDDDVYYRIDIPKRRSALVKVDELEEDVLLPDMDMVQQGDTGREGLEGEDNTEAPANDKLDNQPLFLPRPYTDEDSESEEDRDGEEDIPLDRSLSPEPPKEDNDEEYIPEAEAETEQRVAARAARRLKEAEAYKITESIGKLLERNLRLFNDSRTVTTNGLVWVAQTSLEQIQELAQQYCKVATPRSFATVGSGPGDPLNSQDDEAEQRLTLTVTKEDFFKMRVHGQFNKGFILTTRENELFVIDQHASDEKYNFETLQATTVVQNQPLVVPRVLDLMAMDEITVMDNLDVFKRNGFIIEVDPEMPTGRRCKLISLPMSRETMFGVEGKLIKPLKWCQ